MKPAAQAQRGAALLLALVVVTVIATLAALVAAGYSLREALPWANKAGGIVVGKFGTASASFDEVFGS